MKQLLYGIAAIIVLFLAIRLMSKVKDVPEKEWEQEPECSENDDENEENNEEII